MLPCTHTAERVQVEGTPAERVRILFKGTPKAALEEISDEPYWADLPTRERYAFYRKDVGGVPCPADSSPDSLQVSACLQSLVDLCMCPSVQTSRKIDACRRSAGRPAPSGAPSGTTPCSQ